MVPRWNRTVVSTCVTGMLSVNMYSFIYIVLIVLIIIIIREKGEREKRNKRAKNKGGIIKEKTFAKKVRTPRTLNRRIY